jgi:hypothetical protein
MTAPTSSGARAIQPGNRAEAGWKLSLEGCAKLGGLPLGLPPKRGNQSRAGLDPVFP